MAGVAAVGWTMLSARAAPPATSQLDQHTDILEPTLVPAILDKILRIGEGKIIRQLESISRAVDAIEDDFVAMSDDELRGQTEQFRERLAAGETLNNLVPEAFATVREAAKRVLG